MHLRKNQKVLIFRINSKNICSEEVTLLTAQLIEKVYLEHSASHRVNHQIFQELFPETCVFTYNKHIQEFLGEDIHCVIFKGDSSVVMEQMKNFKEPFFIKDHLPAFLS